MNHRLNEIIDKLQRELNSHRLDVEDFLTERFLSGSPDRVLEAIVSGMNRTLDERDDILTNAFQDITTEFTEVLQQLQKEHLPTNTR
jgi:hypothetical protein